MLHVEFEMNSNFIAWFGTVDKITYVGIENWKNVSKVQYYHKILLYRL